MSEFVKDRATDYEVAGLEWLREAGTEAARVVGVRDYDGHTLTLDRLTSTAPTPEAATDFGRRLASTHDAGAPTYGSPPPGFDGQGWIGVEPMPLGTAASWGEFFAEQRCRPFLQRARDRGALTETQAATIERTLTRLGDGDFDDDESPARIHGDLWSGNAIWTDDGVTLIDPAAHGGHRITDLAMLALFGAPHLDHIYAAYEDAHPLPTGWRSLVPLHQLHPLLVHAAIFGGGYGSEAVAAASRYA